MKNRTVYLRNLLLQRFNWIEARVVEQARAHGYGEVTPAMSRLFGNMAGHTVGLSELSRRMGVSRQAVHKLANDAASLGLVEFVASAEDARVVLLRFTKAGWRMSAQAANDFDTIELVIRDHLGEKKLEELKELLALPWNDEDLERSRR